MMPAQALRMRNDSSADNLNDIAMIGRYEMWREAPAVDTTPISSMTDWSGNGNHLTQSTAGFKPTVLNNAINGRPVALFDGSNDFLMSSSITAMTNTDTRWYYIVFRFDSLPGGTFPVAFCGDNTTSTALSDSLLFGGVADQMLMLFGYASSARNQIAVNSPIGFHLCSIVGDGTNVESKMGVGLADDVTAQSSDQPTGTFKLMLGAENQTTPALFFNGKIAALFMGNTVLTTLEKTRIEAYVLSVFGLAA